MAGNALRAYAWLFAAGALLFAAAPGTATSAWDLAWAWLPGARPLDGGPGLWPPLAAALLAVLALLTRALAVDPRRPAAWNALLASKATSSALFLAWAVAEVNSAFLPAAALDAAILAHLAWLRLAAASAAGGAAGPLAPRLPSSRGPFHEAYFARLNDRGGAALWVRYTLARQPDGSGRAACWYALFDPALPAPVSGSWSLPAAGAASGEGVPLAHPDAGLTPGRAWARSAAASWELAWEVDAPPFRFGPAWLPLLGLEEGYESLPAARFTGSAVIGGRPYRFESAPGCVGHLWGPRLPHSWRWIHAVFDAAPGKEEGRAGPGPSEGTASAFELLSVRPLLLGLPGPRLTWARLWHRGRSHSTASPLGGIFSAPGTEGTWAFRAEFGGLSAAGVCGRDPARSVEFRYPSPDGRELLCRNSKQGWLRLTLEGGTDEVLETRSAAAVESAGPA